MRFKGPMETMHSERPLALLKNKVRRVCTHLFRRLFSRGGEKVVVSFTSYPPRIKYAHRVVRSLFAQLMLPDKIVLYLSRDEFPEGERGLPPELLRCRGLDFEIRWVDGNMKSHKKYLYAVRDFPDALLITVDDDIECRNTLVGELVEGHRRFPHAVIGIRCHVINFDESGKVLPYRRWVQESGNRFPKTLNRPSMRLFSTSGSGMCLPPGSLPQEAFDEHAILKTCLNADDLWLKAMTVMAGWPTVSLPGRQDVHMIEGTQVEALWSENARGGNDRAFAAIREYCASSLGIPAIDDLLRDDSLDALMSGS